MSKGFDIGGILQQAQQLQERLANVQQELASRTVEASAGGGMVTATVNGKLEVVSIRIEPSLLDSKDVDMLQDLVVAAVNEGIRSAQRLVADEMGKVTGGLGIKLPGMP
jgi:DNA-binding YbaB/EbfC family protein